MSSEPVLSGIEGVTGIILVGGEGKRLGRNKASVRIGGRSMLQRVLDRLAPVCDRFLVVTSAERQPPAVSCQRPCQTLVDVLPGLGPLGGMYTGLCASETDLNFVLACDMPLVNAALVRHLAGLTEGYQAVVPVVEGFAKTLHAAYRRECQRPLREALDAGELAVHRFLGRLRVRYLYEGNLRALDPDLLSFLNVNTPADLRKARRLIGEAVDR